MGAVGRYFIEAIMNEVLRFTIIALVGNLAGIFIGIKIFFWMEKRGWFIRR